MEARETCKGDRSGFPTVGLEHITPGEIRLSEYDVGSDNTFTKRFHEGDILFGRRRAYLKKAAIAPFEGICSGDITVIRAIQDKMEPRLLPFVIQNDDFFDFAVGRSAGSLSPRVKWEHLKTYSFELPEMDKQRELADVLWAIEDTRAAYQELAVAMEELVKSQFVELFGETSYPTQAIGDVVDREIARAGKYFNPKDTIYYIDISSIDNSSNTITGYTEHILENAPSRAQYVLKKEDILYSTVRPNLKNIAINRYSEDNIVGSTGFCILRSKAVVTEYLLAVITSDDFTHKMMNKATGANYPAISDKTVLNYKIPIPPLALQNEFATFVREVDKSKLTIREILKKNAAMKLAILREYLK